MNTPTSEPVWTGFDDEQRSMREVLREALADSGDDASAAERIPAALGIMGLLLPESDGGLGLGPMELLLVCEELGARLADATYLTTSVLGAGMLRDLPGDAAARLRAQVAEGDVTLAVADPGSPPRISLDSEGRGHGSVDWVLGGAECDQVLVPTDAGLIAAMTDQEGVDLVPVPTLDQHRRVARLALGGARGVLLCGPEECTRAAAAALDLTELAVCGVAVGGARHALQAAVSYARTRTQFDQPIGSFQAVKHLCAEMLVGLEAAKALAVNAALLMAQPAAPAAMTRDLDAAFLCATEEFVAVAKASTHVHGGVGVTWEFGLHRYLKRALTLDSLVRPVHAVRSRLRTALREEPVG